MKAVEMHYTVAQVSLLVGLCTKSVLAKVKAREFGADVVNLGSELRPDYRLPASGVNAFLASRRVFSESVGISARSTGEIRRKALLVA